MVCNIYIAIDCLQDRMARKNNVVFFVVSEAEGSTREDKMADNKAKIVSIASEVGVQLKDEDILSFKRLGKMGQTRMVKDGRSLPPKVIACHSYRSSKCSAYEKRIQVAVFNIRDEGNTN